MENDIGASFWGGAKTPQAFARVGIRKINNQVATLKPATFVIKSIIPKKSWVCQTAFVTPGDVTLVAISNDTIYYVISSQKLYQQKDGNIKLLHNGPNKWPAMIWHPERNTLFSVTHSRNDEIQELDPNSENPSWIHFGGNPGYVAKEGKFETAVFSWLKGITVDQNGDIYVAAKHVLQKIDLQARTVTSVAGRITDTLGGYQDGKALEAKFRQPRGVAVCEDGTLYVSDQFNFCIRQIKDGIVSTIAGRPGVEGHKDGPLNTAEFTSNINDITVCPDGSLLMSNLEEIRRVDLKANLVSTFSIFQGFVIRNVKGDLFFGDCSNPAETRIMKLIEPTWNTTRLIWIGHLKEDPKSCPLTLLPRELVQEIIYIREGFDDVIHEGICKIIT